MKRFMAITMIAFASMSAGCSLFQGKPKEEKPAAEAKPADQPAQPAPAAYVPDAPAKVAFGPGCTVGWTATQELTSGTTKMTTYWAIVGEAGESWQVEHIAPGMPADHLMGLTVNKADGVVTKAVLGKKGEAGKDHPIAKTGAGAAPTPVSEEVTIKLGKFAAKKTDMGGGNVSWIGDGGDLNGVLLKSTSAGGTFELAAQPTSDFTPVSGSSMAVTSYKYSNGMTQKVTNDRIVAAFFPYEVGKKGLFGMEMQGMSSKIIAVGPSAKPQLMW